MVEWPIDHSTGNTPLFLFDRVSTRASILSALSAVDALGHVSGEEGGASRGCAPSFPSRFVAQANARLKVPSLESTITIHRDERFNDMRQTLQPPSP